MNLLRSLHQLCGRDEAQLGRHWQRLAAEHGEDGERRREFERLFRCAPGDDRIRLGRRPAFDGSHAWFGLPRQTVDGFRAWITGGSGSGKTYLAMGILLQLLRQPMVLWAFDFKSELSDELTGTILPALYSRPEGAWLRGRVHVIDLFGPQVVPLRITEAEAGVPRHVQAMTLSATLQEVLNAEHGVRMERVLLMGGSLAIELGQPLTALSRWFRDPEFFAQAAARSTDPVLQDYALSVFPKEPRASLQAISSRLDLLFFLPELRRALEAPRCISFSELCSEGVFIFRVGGAPAGSEGVEAAIGSLLLGRATRAIMSRVIDEHTLPLLMLLDEGQRAVRPRDIDHLERVLTQARFKRSSFVFCNQDQSAQLDPAFTRLLRTNTSHEFGFRCSPEDAERLAKHLPMHVPGEPEGSQRQALSRLITHLPDRQFVWWAKALGQAELMRSPRVDMPALRRRAGSLPDGVRGQLWADAVGAAGVPRTEPLVQLPLPTPFDDGAQDADLLARLG